MVRVLLVSSQAIPHVGGLSTHFQLLQRTLEDRSALTGAVSGKDVDCGLLQMLGTRVLRLASAEMGRKVILGGRLKRIIRRLECMIQNGQCPGLVHCHDPLATVAAVRALRNCGMRLPVIQTVHGPWSRETIMGGASRTGAHVSRIRAFEKEAFSDAAHLIAVDTGQADILAADFHVPPQKITVIPNAVDVTNIASLLGGPVPAGISEPYFVVPRRLVRKNGVEVAVRAMAHLGKSAATLVVAGDGPLRNELRRCASDLNIPGRIIFLGDVERAILLPLMRRSLGVIIPSVPSEGVVEATSLAALEGLACGAPLIASGIGGLSEIVSRASIGFLFPPGDAVALASLMKELERMPAAALNTLRSCSLAAAQLFDVDKWFDSIHTLYMSVCPTDASGHSAQRALCL